MTLVQAYNRADQLSQQSKQAVLIYFDERENTSLCFIHQPRLMKIQKYMKALFIDGKVMELW